MKEMFRRHPLCCLFQPSLFRQHLPEQVFLAAVFAVSLVLLCLPFSKTVQRALIGKFHLTTSSFLQWTILQVIPSMYNFENVVEISRKPFQNPGKDGSPEGELWEGGKKVWVNHYPLRLATFSLTDRAIPAESGPVFFRLRSKYRGSEQVTDYLLMIEDEHLKILQYETFFRPEILSGGTASGKR